MKNYHTFIEEDVTGELYITLPDELVNHLGWKENELINFNLQEDGTILLQKEDS